MIADENTGLIAAYVLDGDGGGYQTDMASALTEHTTGKAIWLHFDLNVDATKTWLQNQSGLPQIVAESMLAHETRPRVIEEKNGCAIVLRGVNLNPGADPEDMVGIRIWIDERRIISVRYRSLMAISDIRQLLATGSGPNNSTRFVTMIAELLTDRMASVIDSYAEGLEQLEESQNTARLETRSTLRNIRRGCSMLRRYLAPQREALGRLQIDESGRFTGHDRSIFREVADRNVRYLEELDQLRERAIIIQDEITNLLSERMNRIVYILTIISAIMLPLGLLTGLLGINVGGIPGADNPVAFWLVCGGLGLLAGIEGFIFYRLRWLFFD